MQDPLCISLVHQYLASTNSALADQFKNKYQPQKTNVELKEVLSKWKEEQLVRGLIYQHLKTVAPTLAVEFRNTHFCSLESVPQHLIRDFQEQLLAIAKRREISKVEDENGAKQEQRKNSCSADAEVHFPENKSECSGTQQPRWEPLLSGADR